MNGVQERQPMATTREVAAYLNLSVQALHDLRHKDRAPKASKIGRSLRWKWSDVDTWVESKAS